MKKYKYLFVAFLLAITCLSYPVAANTAQAVTTADKANILNKLSIISGNGNGDFMLGSALIRSQAAAFIVKFLGKDSYVTQNGSTLSATKFTDVPATQWYAPYVGYCTQQGIIAGVSVSSFKPNDPISEKSFLKLVLVSLGYTYGTDFNWTNVYSTAYNAGIVTDAAYKTKTQDNSNYTRSDVVNVLYNALTKENKATKVSMLQNLINQKAITIDQAISTGILNLDNNTVTIQMAQSATKNTVVVQLSKPVNEIAQGNISVYKSSDPTQKLDVTIQAQQPSALVLKTADQLPYEAYTVELDNVKAVGGVLSTAVVGSFTGFKPDVVNSDFFKISKVEAVDKYTINAYFTHPLNANSGIASYYSILNKDGSVFASGSQRALTVKFPGTPDNKAVITLQGVIFKDGEQYTLKVGGDLTSLYTVKLNDGTGDTMRFAASGKDPAAASTDSNFAITGISLLDSKTIQLVFNKQVHPARAQQVSSFYITDPNGNYIPISKAAVAGTDSQAGKIILLNINSTLIKTYNYKIMVNEIDDINNQYSIQYKEYTFSGAYSDRPILNIQSVSALDKNTISVVFDRPMDETTATTKEYYQITGITQIGFYTSPAKVMFDSEINPNMVKLFLSPDKELIAGSKYKLTVIGAIKDSLGNVAGLSRETTFNGSSVSAAKPYIQDAVLISKDTIKITTNREIALDMPNISADNYSLTFDDNGTIITKVPLIVGYINSTTLVLKFDSLDLNKVYTLAFNSLKDYSELYTRALADGQTSIQVRAGK